MNERKKHMQLPLLGTLPVSARQQQLKASFMWPGQTLGWGLVQRCCWDPSTSRLRMCRCPRRRRKGSRLALSDSTEQVILGLSAVQQCDLAAKAHDLASALLIAAEAPI